ncbi:hypothetical protein PSHT_12142 [Puccinia striiformis]|uniref:Uncharacterized protein n=2 Tax=Puccinia striiformis TaxID=27350 RepID=A0A0L0W4D1_9BASI|nr:hypothetical protein H4Q26_013733 [Puccinia striiformis f. sp. tritici PST-130]KAI9631608.1 hypothetical protein KEM48_014590 [Puccinia striiformis f. sp. tritici PST-130]KNF06366.1 hypothetical protein PSTG_00249 [Puccinia striiformis f. sp. tritici PST-78]POW02352.1 hypothetical protein PSHT_12142 [Puccinia striiformis]
MPEVRGKSAASARGAVVGLHGATGAQNGSPLSWRFQAWEYKDPDPNYSLEVPKMPILNSRGGGGVGPSRMDPHSASEGRCHRSFTPRSVGGRDFVKLAKMLA